MPDAIGSIAGDVLGAVIGGNAAKSAASTQAKAAAAALAEQRRQFDLVRGDQAPYREAGVEALTRLRSFQDPNLTAAEVMAEPGYQFGLEQGLGNIQNTAAAAGGLYSGNALKALTRYGNDYASTKYGDSWNRLQATQDSRWNRFASLAGIAQKGNSQVASAGQNYANQFGDISMSNANAQAAAGIARANLMGNALNGVISAGKRWRQTSSTPQFQGKEWWAGGDGYEGE